ncbi:MAG: NAD-dependent epimerase/dehydratase family protein [Jatrophihabitans sp.]
MDPDAPVMVTGGSGYIAGWIIKYLLEAGRTVHATVRDPDKAHGLEHLHSMSAAHPGTLTLFRADLLDAGSFDEAMLGCELVLHTASPFIISGFTDANEALVRPALDGTRNVLDAVNRTASVKRVVLTSSVAAIYGDNIDLRDVPGGVFTEQHWNTTSTIDHQPYPYSKTLAEREAWTIHDKQDRWDLITINPGLVLGPSLAKASASTSLSTMKQLTDGTMALGAPSLSFGIADVRDVARAHLLAGSTADAHGRHIVTAGTVTFLQMGKMLRSRFGNRYLFPRFTAPKAVVLLIAPVAGLTRDFVRRNVGHPISFDNSRSRHNLGVEYWAIDDTLADHFQQMLDDGIVKSRRPPRG